MQTLKVLAACCVFGSAVQANAETLNFTGTFNSYALVGIAIPLTGVNTSLASWPAYDTDLTAAGFQNTTFSVSGTVDITAGVVTGAVINQTSPLLVDTAGATGYTTASYSNISWTYSGGTTLPLTPGNGPNVTGTCTIVTPAGSGQCALQLTNLQNGSATSTWNWLGIAPNFLVSDLFGGSNVFFLDISGAGGYPGVAWTVSGNNITGQVTQGVPNVTNTLFTAYQGRFNLVSIPAPTAGDDGPINVLPTTPSQLDVLANDVGFTDPVTVTLGTPPGKGTALVSGSPGNRAAIRITYTGNVGESGTDTFTYTVDDGDDSDSATVTVNITDAGAGDDAASTTRNTPVGVNVGVNDLGFGNAVTVTINNGSFTAGGSATVTAGQGGPASGVVVTYTPVSAPGAPGYSETFTYTIDDGSLPSATATVTASVANTVPVASAGSTSIIATVGVDPNTRTGTFTAPGVGGSLGNGGTITVTTPGTRGTTSVIGAVISYVPASNFFTGSDAFSYTITDSDGETSSAEVSVTIANALPTLADSQIRTNEGTASAQLNPGISPGNGSLAQHGLSVSSQATNGTCAISPANGAGLVTYTPNAGFVGSDSCGLTTTDGDGQVDTGTVSITVDPVINGAGSFKGGSSGLDPWALSLLAGLAWWRRRRLHGSS